MMIEPNTAHFIGWALLACFGLFVSEIICCSSNPNITWGRLAWRAPLLLVVALVLAWLVYAAALLVSA